MLKVRRAVVQLHAARGLLHLLGVSSPSVRTAYSRSTSKLGCIIAVGQLARDWSGHQKRPLVFKSSRPTATHLLLRVCGRRSNTVTRPSRVVAGDQLAFLLW